MSSTDLPSDEAMPGASLVAPSLPERASAVFRVAAALVGLAALLVTSLGTAGGAFVATVGMAAAYAIAKRKGRPLTLGASWIGAVTAAGLAIFTVASLTFYLLPPGTLTKIQRSYDSTLVAGRTVPPPPWMERMAPGSSVRTRQLAGHPGLERGFNIWIGAMSAVMFWAITSIFVGTIGWACGLLLAFALAGRWLPRTVPLAPAR
jgi:hypothetical protein